MTRIAGRSFGVWGLLSIIAGAAVIIPSMATLVVTLFAVAGAVF